MALPKESCDQGALHLNSPLTQNHKTANFHIILGGPSSPVAGLPPADRCYADFPSLGLLGELVTSRKVPRWGWRGEDTCALQALYVGFFSQKFPALRFRALLTDGAQEVVHFERVAVG